MLHSNAAKYGKNLERKLKNVLKNSWCIRTWLSENYFNKIDLSFLQKLRKLFRLGKKATLLDFYTYVDFIIYIPLTSSVYLENDQINFAFVLFVIFLFFDIFCRQQFILRIKMRLN